MLYSSMYRPAALNAALPPMALRAALARASNSSTVWIFAISSGRKSPRYLRMSAVNWAARLALHDRLRRYSPHKV